MGTLSQYAYIGVYADSKYPHSIDGEIGQMHGVRIIREDLKIKNGRKSV